MGALSTSKRDVTKRGNYCKCSLRNLVPRGERDPGNEVVACVAGVNGEGVPSPPFFLLSARSPSFTPFTPATQATTVGTTAIGALLQNAVLQNTTIIIIIGVNHKRR